MVGVAGLLAACGASTAPESPAAEFGDDADAFAQSLVDRALTDGVPGVSVSVVDADGLLATAAGGVADADEGVPVRVDTLSHAGSTHKALNAFFVATVVDDGLMAWDDEVVDLVDDPGVGDGVTVADLLAMAGGIPADAEELIDWGGVDDGPIDRVAFDAIAATEPIAAPGEVFEYSNLSASLAGYAAAAATDASSGDLHVAYRRAFRERVLDPLGMGDTLLLASEAAASGRLSRSHDVDDGVAVVLDSIDVDADVLLPSGGLKTTATDLGRFLTAMLADGDGIVDAEQIERMWGPVLEDYALGWQVTTSGASEVRFHEGSYDGFLSVIVVLPDDGVGLVLLANTETPAAGVVGDAPEMLATWVAGR